MVAKRDNVVGQRVQAPAHGHNPLEIMTQQDYSIDTIAAPAGSLLIGGESPPPSITFNTKDVDEIARFTEEGFYYKGEFIDDAGEVHRLLKEVLNGICYKQLCKDLVDELEGWIAFGDSVLAPGLEEDIVDAHALVDRARAALGI
jgi:hypothetical protein